MCVAHFLWRLDIISKISQFFSLLLQAAGEEALDGGEDAAQQQVDGADEQEERRVCGVEGERTGCVRLGAQEGEHRYFPVEKQDAVGGEDEECDAGDGVAERPLP